jgi:hypothetical protein
MNDLTAIDAFPRSSLALLVTDTIPFAHCVFTLSDIQRSQHFFDG